MNFIKTTAIFVLLTFSLQIFAQSQLSKDNQDALKKTQELLTNVQKRQKAIEESKDAQKADGTVNQLVNTQQQKDQVYGIASDVFRDLATGLNGDSQQMMELLQKAQQDPESFYKALSGNQKAAIKKLANDIEKSNK